MFLVFIAYSYCEPVIGMCGKNSIFLISTWHWIAKNLKKYIEAYTFIYAYLFHRYTIKSTKSMKMQRFIYEVIYIKDKYELLF